jgi:hypothetical protein
LGVCKSRHGGTLHPVTPAPIKALPCLCLFAPMAEKSKPSALRVVGDSNGNLKSGFSFKNVNEMNPHIRTGSSTIGHKPASVYGRFICWAIVFAYLGFDKSTLTTIFFKRFSLATRWRIEYGFDQNN